MYKLTAAVFAALLCLAWAASSVAADAEYVGNSQCKMCHNKKEEGEIWTVWSKEKHHRAFEALASPEAKAIAEKRGLAKPPQEAPECLRCHVTGYDATKTPPVPAKITASDGVQCETCHGPASLHVQDGKAFKMKKDTSVNMAAHIKRGDEQTCRKCHNEESPTWNPEQYTREDGTKTGFDFKAAWKDIQHQIPGK